jgi:hypothetical protein
MSGIVVVRNNRTLFGKGNGVRRSVLWYELRFLGLIALLTPIFVVIGIAGFAWIMALGGEEADSLAKTLTWSMETLFPLAAGMVAATVVAADPGVEWQLTLPMPYRVTIFRRLGIIVVWSCIVALADVIALRVFGWWVVPEGFAISQLTWLAPLLGFVALGGALSLLLRNRSASAGLVGGLFIIEVFLHGAFLAHAWARPWFFFATAFAPGADYWLMNRLTLIALAGLLAIAIVALLGRSEILLIGGEA